ncbi:hypothetical protein BRD00_04820 [Halobacteriales archaeon QS_8_69_26]|nr:MAG: hypothetical protein BRD00_04820 [Halobacteriales archaeon QS_8_69_26]
MTDEDTSDDRTDRGASDQPGGTGAADQSGGTRTTDPDAGAVEPADDTAEAEGDRGTGAAGDATPDGGAGTADPISEAATSEESRTKSLLLWVTLIVLSVLALVALLQFYLNASAAINRWIAPEYRRIMQAVFNLAVLLVSGIGIALVVRELGD